MRYIAIHVLLREVLADEAGTKDKKRLTTAHLTVAKKAANARQSFITSNGATKWTPIKNRLTAKLGNKCWYTEAELVGASLTIDHYRPKCDYWFLAFQSENFRVACPFANSPKHNEEHGCAGGKGDEFPLLDSRHKAHGAKRIKHERPVILDPCNEGDCKLIAFQPDGRPVIHPDFANDPVALERVEKSKILLNLDHPDFNTKREQIYNEISNDVQIYEALAEGTDEREAIRTRISSRISAAAPFSVAARQYLSAFRYLDWVDTVI